MMLKPLITTISQATALLSLLFLQALLVLSSSRTPQFQMMLLFLRSNTLEKRQNEHRRRRPLLRRTQRKCGMLLAAKEKHIPRRLKHSQKSLIGGLHTHTCTQHTYSLFSRTPEWMATQMYGGGKLLQTERKESIFNAFVFDRARTLREGKSAVTPILCILYAHG